MTGAPLVIALVNNMPDAALKATERQFRRLLAAAADVAVELQLFRLPGVPRSGEAAAWLDAHGYEDVARLRHRRIDGLIVTGTEPHAAALADEPYWPALAGLVDWAEHHTRSTIWSCLAAHAAVWHRDGIARAPLGRKLCGVFDCRRGEDHPIVAGLPRSWPMPHSRRNGLAVAALVAKGYRLLSLSDSAGADLFVSQRGSLFVFLQGHPEYDAAALYREYRRDVCRFLAGERDAYPELPHRYFDDEAAAAFAAFRERAVAVPDPALAAQFPAVAASRLGDRWHPAACRLYRNWLRWIAHRQSAAACAAAIAAG